MGNLLRHKYHLPSAILVLPLMAGLLLLQLWFTAYPAQAEMATLAQDEMDTITGVEGICATALKDGCADFTAEEKALFSQRRITDDIEKSLQATEKATPSLSPEQIRQLETVNIELPIIEPVKMSEIKPVEMLEIGISPDSSQFPTAAGIESGVIWKHEDPPVTSIEQPAPKPYTPPAPTGGFSGTTMGGPWQ